MKYAEGKVGRIFVIRMEDGDKLPEVLESFARDNKVSNGMCILVGGIKGEGKIVVGPENGETLPVEPMISVLKGVHEIVAAGTLFPDENGYPKLHMHAALGRGETVKSGCIRPGVETWKLGEIILLEITGINSRREKDAETGFGMLNP